MESRNWRLKSIIVIMFTIFTIIMMVVGGLTALADGSTVNIDTIQMNLTSFTYDGQEKRPRVTIEGLTEGVDFTVSYKNNINAGTAQVIVTGIGGYSGTKTINFSIAAAAMSNVTVNVANNSVTYSGEKQEQEPVVTYKGMTLEKGRDYTVSYGSDTINAGTVRVTVTAVAGSNYSGSNYVEYEIAKANLANATVSVANDNVVYDGQKHEQVPTVVYKGKTLSKDVDYTVSYSENTVNIGTVRVTVTAVSSSNFTGSNYKEYGISQILLSNATVSVLQNEVVYDGLKHEQVPTVQYKGTTLKKDVDYTVSYSSDTVNVGNVTVTVTAKNGSVYSGSNTAVYSITAASLSNATISVANSSLVYTGQKQEQVPIVKMNSVTLIKDKDYTVSYGDNTTNVGTVKVTVTAVKGSNYAESKDAEYQITAAPLSKATVTVPLAAVTYDGQKHEQVPSVSYNGMNLVKDRDYTVSYSEDTTSVGTVRVTVTAIAGSQYSGSNYTEYQIGKASLASAKVSVSEKAIVYDGQKHEQEPTVEYGGMVLTKGKDYTVSYSADTTNVGTVRVTVTAVGGSSYTDSNYDEYSITVASLANATVSVAKDEVVYSGQKQEQDPKVVFNRATLVKDRDYTVSYSKDTTNVGTVKVTVTAVAGSNFVGTNFKEYTIQQAPLTSATITVASNKVVYSGEKQEQEPTVKYNGMTLTKDVDYTVSYSDDTTNAGTVTVTITAKPGSNYVGSNSKSYTIDQADLSSANVEVDDVVEEFDRAKHEKIPTVKYNKMTLTDGLDYTVSYSKDTINVGTVTVTVTAVLGSNYKGSNTAEYAVVPTSLLNASVSIPEDELVYTGQKLEQLPVVVFNGEELTKDTDYTVSYNEDTVNVGTVTVTVTAVNGSNYEGSNSKEYAITKASLENAQIIVDDEEIIYDGKTHEQLPKVTYMGMILQKDADYSISYSEDTTNVGTIQVTVTALENTNYKDENSVTYSIIQRPVTVSLNNEKFEKLCGTEGLILKAKADERQLIEGDAMVYTYRTDGDTVFAEGIGNVNTIAFTITRETGEGVGEYGITLAAEENQGNYLVSVSQPTAKYSINWLDSPSIEANIMGEYQNGWYCGTTSAIVSFDGYSFADDEITDWSTLQAIQSCFAANRSYNDGFVSKTVYLRRDTDGAITRRNVTVCYKQDTVAPIWEIEVKGTQVEALAIDEPGNGLTDASEVSGPRIIVTRYGRPFDEIEPNMESSVETEGEMVLVDNRITGKWNLTGGGEYVFTVMDLAGHEEEMKRLYLYDKDQDGINDLYEQSFLKTDPERPDTDGDGLSDGEEFSLGTNPLSGDTDADGIGDNIEIQLGYVDPKKADTDSDGISDLLCVLMSRYYYGGETVPAAMNISLGYKVNMTDAVLNAEEIVESLDKLSMDGLNYLDLDDSIPYTLKSGKTVARDKSDVINLQKLKDIVMFKSSSDRSMMYGIYPNDGLFVSFKVNRYNMIPEYAFDLKSIFGMSASSYSVVCDDQGMVFAVVPWDSENGIALSNIAIIVPSEGRLWRIRHTVGSTRFEVSPDGSKIAYINEGVANLLDLITCNPLDAYTAEASMLAFTENGGMITRMNGNEATLYNVMNYELCEEQAAFCGGYHAQQPTLTTNVMAFHLTEEDTEIVNETISEFTITLNGHTSAPVTLNSLTYKQDDEKYAHQYRSFFAQ